MHRVTLTYTLAGIPSRFTVEGDDAGALIRAVDTFACDMAEAHDGDFQPGPMRFDRVREAA